MFIRYAEFYTYLTPLLTIQEKWNKRSVATEVHLKYVTVNSAICKTCGTKKSRSFPGGSYKLDIVIPETYPFNPPKVNVTFI